jgi:hypothetical protein
MLSFEAQDVMCLPAAVLALEIKERLLHRRSFAVLA